MIKYRERQFPKIMLFPKGVEYGTNGIYQTPIISAAILLPPFQGRRTSRRKHQYPDAKADVGENIVRTRLSVYDVMRMMGIQV